MQEWAVVTVRCLNATNFFALNKDPFDMGTWSLIWIRAEDVHMIHTWLLVQLGARSFHLHSLQGVWGNLKLLLHNGYLRCHFGQVFDLNDWLMLSSILDLGQFWPQSGNLVIRGLMSHGNLIVIFQGFYNPLGRQFSVRLRNLNFLRDCLDDRLNVLSRCGRGCTLMTSHVRSIPCMINRPVHNNLRLWDWR